MINNKIKYGLIALAAILLAAGIAEYKYSLIRNFFYYENNGNKAEIKKSDADLPGASKEKKEVKVYMFTEKNLTPRDNNSLKDSNNDGLPDEQAKKMGLDPKKLDTDGDGIFDIDEIKTTLTDPLKKDTDSDGYNDLEELRSGHNPNGTGKLERK
ncbi:MAG: hypothetical protein Q7R92_00495 [bacterium]|nr:hypothetical protein [bacterium]